MLKQDLRSIERSAECRCQRTMVEMLLDKAVLRRARGRRWLAACPLRKLRVSRRPVSAPTQAAHHGKRVTLKQLKSREEVVALCPKATGRAATIAYVNRLHAISASERAFAAEERTLMTREDAVATELSLPGLQERQEGLLVSLRLAEERQAAEALEEARERAAMEEADARSLAIEAVHRAELEAARWAAEQAARVKSMRLLREAKERRDMAGEEQRSRRAAEYIAQQTRAQLELAQRSEEARQAEREGMAREDARSRVARDDGTYDRLDDELWELEEGERQVCRLDSATPHTGRGLPLAAPLPFPGAT